MKFMGRTLRKEKNGVGWTCYESYPLIGFSQCVDGTWFGSVSFSNRAQSLNVRGRPTLRASIVAMRKLVRALKLEMEPLK